MRRRFTLAALALAAFLGVAAPAQAAYDDTDTWTTPSTTASFDADSWTPPASTLDQTAHWDWGS